MGAGASSSVKSSSPQLTRRASLGAWTKYEVADELSEIGFEKYQAIVDKHDVAGSALETLTPEDMLKIGISDADVNAMMEWIGKAKLLKEQTTCGTNSSDYESFVCQPLLQHYAKVGSHSGAAETEAFDGVIFFSDLAGFTALCENLKHERVSAHLNNIFGAMIATIRAHGGDVLKFAGDALVSMFWGGGTSGGSESEALPLVCLRAVQCALEFQQRLGTHNADGVTMTLHLGLVAGSLSSLNVGGVGGAWEYLVTGQPFDELDQCVSSSPDGEVVVSERVWTAVESRVSGRRMENGLYEITGLSDAVPRLKLRSVELPPEVKAVVTAYVPDVVINDANKDAENQLAEWLNEVRRVSIIFVCLSGLRLEFEPGRGVANVGLVQRALVTMQEAVNSRDGFVRQFLVDDKGTVLIAAFGVPHHTHEDDSARAVACGLAIKNGLDAIPLRCGIGVTTGEVFCGTVGNQTRLEYAVVGDPVNLSARLMKASMPGILCDEITFRVCHDSPCGISFQDPPPAPVKVKGKKLPVVIHRPLAEGRGDSSLLELMQTKRHMSNVTAGQPLLGRDAEMKTLKAATLELVENKVGGVILIEGSAGSGKTHMIGELVDYALSLPVPPAVNASENANESESKGEGKAGDDATRSVTCLFGVAAAAHAGTPYALWFGVLCGILQINAALMQSVEGQQTIVDFAMGRLRALADGDEEMLGAFGALSVVLRFPLSTFGEASLGDNMGMCATVNKCLRFLIEKLAAAGPVMILLEQLEVADALSLNLIGSFAQLPNVLVVAASQPVAGADSAPGMMSMGYKADTPNLRDFAAFRHATPNLRVVSLKPLKPAFLANIAMHCLQSKPKKASSDLQRFLKQRSDGNPTTAIQLTLALEHTQQLVVNEEGVCDLSSPDAVALPSQIAAAVSIKMDTLSVLEKTVAKVGSMMGPMVRMALLRVTLPDHSDQVILATCASLCDKTILKELVEGRVWRFDSALMREVVENSATALQRVEVHKSIVRFVLDPSSPENRNVIPAATDLMHHFNGMLELSTGGSLDTADQADLVAAAECALEAYDEANRVTSPEMQGWVEKLLALCAAMPEGNEDRERLELVALVLRSSLDLLLNFVTMDFSFDMVRSSLERALVLAKKQTPSSKIMSQYEKAVPMANFMLGVCTGDGRSDVVAEWVTHYESVIPRWIADPNVPRGDIVGLTIGILYQRISYGHWERVCELAKEVLSRYTRSMHCDMNITQPCDPGICSTVFVAISSLLMGDWDTAEKFYANTIASYSRVHYLTAEHYVGVWQGAYAIAKRDWPHLMALGDAVLGGCQLDPGDFIGDVGSVKYFMLGTLYKGYAMAMSGADVETGCAMVTGVQSQWGFAYKFSLVASAAVEVLTVAGKKEEALAVCTSAFAREMGVAGLWEPELRRLYAGLLLVLRPGADAAAAEAKAEEEYAKGLAQAREQSCRVFALRIGLDIAARREQQGRAEEGVALLRDLLDNGPACAYAAATATPEDGAPPPPAPDRAMPEAQRARKVVADAATSSTAS